MEYTAPFPIFILRCAHRDHGDFMRHMLGIAPREAILITWAEYRDSPDERWPSMRGYNRKHGRWLMIWEEYGIYWCCRGDEAKEWTVSPATVEEMRVLVEKHRQEQRVFK